MQTPALQQRLANYRQWKQRLERAVRELERWLAEHRRATPRARSQIKTSLDMLTRDRLTVAVIGDSGRGRTELVNALFFADLGGRLLPVTSDQASPCPIECLWDDRRNEAYVRLLPVETRAQDTPVAVFKADPKHWVHYPLSAQGPEQMSATLREILQTKTVSRSEAARLGFSADPAAGAAAAATVEIPKWRHAIVSFPHPLLKLGLVVLAAPDGATLSRDPELALGILPAAQAVLFVLAADLGVTREDLHIWQHHLKGFRETRQRATLVALNRADRLWDTRREAGSAETAVTLARRSAAETLGVPEDLIFTVSGQKGLLAKIRRDDGLLRRSALPALERQLAGRLLETKHRILVESLEERLGQLLERNRGRIASRIARVKSQLDELERLQSRSQDVIAQLLERTRRQQEAYLRGVARYQESREQLLAETALCRRILERENVGHLLAQAHRELNASVSTWGLNRAMKALLENLRRTMQTIAGESERLRKLVRDTYRAFREDLEMEVEPPKVFVPMKYRVEVELLYQEVETFRRSPAMILYRRRAIIRRFDQQIVSRARVLFDQLRVTFDEWIRETLKPLAAEIHAHKARMETQLANLQRLARSRDALEERARAMESQHVQFAQELTALRNIYNALHYDPLVEPEAPQRPRLVSL